MERSSSWFRWWRRRKSREGQAAGAGEEEGHDDHHKVVVDGSEIRELVEDREAFGMLVDSKFRQLDADGDGRLSVRELRPAVADIGAALGLPAEGASPNTDHICSEVVSELTHGTSQGEVSKAEFQEALSDILLGMAAGLKRDPIVILRMDGEDLRDFAAGSRYEPSAAAIFPQVGSEGVPLRQCLLAALQELSVDHGVPPASDAWVVENIVEPALQQLPADRLEQPAASRDGFLQQLKMLLGAVAERLQEQPVIVAHTENTYDGSGVKRLLANKFELDKLLDSVWRGVPSEHKNKASKECLVAALDKMADAASLPHYGAVKQVDAVVDEAIKTANAGDGKTVDEAQFKKFLTDTLGAIMRQLNSNPVFVSTNTVVHEPLSSGASSALFSSPQLVTSSPSK
ncbi:hypothetical protein SEVIR_9G472000v4 [Setaria viridis]|uniref:EF-hand domain-containing protein n=1 Tax=Setaria viridis TaxID=4556 RepID=A0A4V6D235_SETVI|nr:uncharacterized protein LOC117836441 [Setaria viridis]TKV97075.1 hypothetical protein SEVIR_9G472000v2 [Setaria viridis]TKV97076.1 hypothetical protein SEVIR_9G472000v2 [Setaria viridis]TKV97077.1 hypothetical protein SEVIR_9G472000v2 [Setaria viridis]